MAGETGVGVRITRTIPPAVQPPAEFTMTFSQDEGWALRMALLDAHAKYVDAADREDWKKWAQELDGLLRR